MYKRGINIVGLITFFTLVVFTIAIISCPILHHHPKPRVEAKKNCSHQFHLNISDDPCLFCKTHFEKDFIHKAKIFEVYLVTQNFFINNPVSKRIYINLITASLRGPPHLS